jgi:hypothetical protein
MQPAPTRPPLSEAVCRRFAALALVDRLASEPGAFHAALLEGDDAFLEPVFDQLLREDLAAIGEDDHYRLTALGRRAYQRLLHLQQSCLAHFDIFAGVDLGAGAFAEPERDYLDDPRWTDLRVAVAEYKGMDPYRLVFLSLLAGGQFFASSGWKFDLALGSSFFRELEEVVLSQVRLEELAYVDEDGTAVAAQDVLEDVILRGAAINQQRLAELRRRAADPDAWDGPGAGSAPDGDEDAAPGTDAAAAWQTGFDPGAVPYDPLGPAAAYAGSARFVEPLWLEGDW